MPHLLDHKLSVVLHQDCATPDVHSEVIRYLAVPWLGWLAAGLSLWTAGCRPKASPHGFCGGKSGTGIALCMSASVLLCQYHCSINFLFSFIHLPLILYDLAIDSTVNNMFKG